MSTSISRLVGKLTSRSFSLKPYNFTVERPRSFRLAGLSIAGSALVLGIPVFFYPFADVLIWPWAIETSMLKEKNLPYPANLDLQRTRKQLMPILKKARNKSKIVLIKGSDASNLGRAFAAKTFPCGYLDFRTLFDMNAYESLCFQHIGWHGNVLNVVMKLVIFATSVIKGSMGSVESHLPFTMNCFNNLRRVLQKLRDEPRNENEMRYLVFDNFGELVEFTKFCKGSTREGCEHAQVAYITMMRTFVCEDLCSVVLIWKNLDEAKDEEGIDPWQDDFLAYVEEMSEVIDLDVHKSNKTYLKSHGQWW